MTSASGVYDGFVSDYALPKMAVFLLVFALVAEVPAQESATLELTKTIPLPGVEGRFDHFGIDLQDQRLFVAALGNDTLEVLDLAAGKRLHSVVGLRKPTGVLYLPAPNRLFVANGDDGTFQAFAATDFKRVSSLGSLEDADNVRYDARSETIYVGYGDGALGVTDTAAATLIASVKLPAHPESFQLEKQGNRIFVNVPGANQVAVIDREKRALIASWPMKQFKANFPLALDETNHRLFVGCRSPAKLVVMDSTDGKIVTDLTISGDTDDLFYDAKRKRLYVSCGEGLVDVIEQRSADSYQLRARIKTSAGARTSFFSPERDEFYLAVPELGGQAAEVRVFAVQD